MFPNFSISLYSPCSQDLLNVIPSGMAGFHNLPYMFLSKLVQITDHRRSEKAKALIVKPLFNGKSNLVDGINIRLIH